MSTNAPTKNSPKKKSPKKPFSITRHVTAKYQLQQQQSNVPVMDITSEFFTIPAGSEKKPQSPEMRVSKAAPRKPRAARTTGAQNKKASSKSKKHATKQKLTTSSVNKLLSPTGAASKLVGQDILFGTSSQLLNEGSPTYLRQLQHALRASEAGPDTSDHVVTSSRAGLRFSSAALARSGGGLWSKAAANEKGRDLFMQRALSASPAVDDFQSDGAPQRDDDCFAVTQVTQPETTALVADEGEQSEWRDVDDVSLLFSTERPLEVSTQTSNENIDAGQGAVDEIGWKLSGNASDRPVDNPTKLGHATHTSGGFISHCDTQHGEWFPRSSPLLPVSTLLETQPRAALSHTMQTDRSALRLMSTNRKITGSITENESPKKSKNSIAATKGIKSTKSASRDQGPLPAKKPRGRPPKAKQNNALGPGEGANLANTLSTTPTKASPMAGDARKFWKDIDAIEDSEPDKTPPLRRQRGRARRKPPALPELVSAEAANKRIDTALVSAKHAHWPEIQAILFAQITVAIKANPPSKDVTKPSWNEKIALYDPIVIEDLTSWLHANGIRIMVGEREEEVKGWMVQKWCEEHSVTCLWREGLWGGVKTMY
jgi:hypothetical protein